MSSKVKEDEKNEKIIRGLLKLPGNRKCINCDVLGPQYVCVTFSTFVCTNCCGVHREFTHRVKSVSMAKFTPQEIAALQDGGNERAKEVFFKEWDSQRLKAPDSSNGDKLRSFIKHVYVDRRYTGEKSIDRPPRSKMGDNEEPNEDRRKSDPRQSSSRRSSKDNERRYSDKDSQRYSEYGRNPVPVRSAIVSNWRREDRFSNGKKSDDGSPDVEIKPEMKSPDSQNDSSTSSLSAVQPVGDLLGDNVTPLQVNEPPSANDSGTGDGAVITQGITSSDGLDSSNGNPIELKEETSLIDFDASFEHDLTVAVVTQDIPVPATQTLEAETSKTQELPMDLFTVTYPTISYQEPAWQAGSVPGVGFPMQYNAAMSTPTFPQPMQAANPFNTNALASPPQAAAFPSMSSVNAALPNMGVQGGSAHDSILGDTRPSWMPPQTSSYPSAMPSYGTAFRPPIQGAYMGQQLQSNMPSSRPQGLGSFGTGGIPLGSVNPSLGGNPFG